jgi:hypothetical protein
MSLFVLDTDILSLWQHGHPEVKVTLVTRNTRDSSRVEGLKLEDWSK